MSTHVASKPSVKLFSKLEMRTGSTGPVRSGMHVAGPVRSARSRSGTGKIPVFRSGTSDSPNFVKNYCRLLLNCFTVKGASSVDWTHYTRTVGLGEGVLL